MTTPPALGYNNPLQRRLVELVETHGIAQALIAGGAKEKSAMTITLAPEAETALRKTAERTGQEPDIIVSRLLVETLAQIEQEYADDVAAIQEAMEDVRAGRERPYEEYMAERRLRSPNAASI